MSDPVCDRRVWGVDVGSKPSYTIIDVHCVCGRVSHHAKQVAPDRWEVPCECGRVYVVDVTGNPRET